MKYCNMMHCLYIIIDQKSIEYDVLKYI